MLKNLKDFANAIFDAVDWPDGFALDGADFQEIAVKYGLLVPETRYEPCGEHCNCLEYYTKKEMAQGVTCYRKAEWLNADVDPRLLTPDAPEMTVGDSGSVSEHSTNKRVCEYCEEAPPNLIGICDSCYEIIFKHKRLKKQLCEEIEHDISFDAGYKYCPDCGELLLPPYQEDLTPSPTPSFR